MRTRLLAMTAAVTALLLLASPAHAIVNGQRDGNAHPYVGALTVEYGGARVLACTGALISPTVLVTAAHCTAMLQQLGYDHADVTFQSDIGNGTDFPCALVDCVVEPDPSSLHTGTLHTNPAFNGNTTGVDSHDVAVVTFDEPITDIAPAHLPTAGQLDAMAATSDFSTQVFTDVGYGWHSVVSNADGMFDGVRRTAPSGARALTTSDLRLSGNAALGLGGACDHDSGSPTLTDGDVVTGVVSGVEGGHCQSYYSYRLDTASARSFLGGYVALP